MDIPQGTLSETWHAGCDEAQRLECGDRSITHERWDPLEAIEPVSCAPNSQRKESPMTKRATILAVMTAVASTLAGSAAFAQETNAALPEAQTRRRPVRWGTPTPAPGGGCYTFNSVRAGLKASYRTVSKDGTVTYQITYVSDSDAQTKVTQRIQSPGPSGTVNTDAETTMDWEMVAVTGGNGRALKSLFVKSTSPVAGFSLVTETTSTFAPSLLTGPKSWCAGSTFRVPPSNQTVVTKATPGGTTTTLNVTNEMTIRILAVSESITVPGGTFDTVKHDGVAIAGAVVNPVTVWMSKQHSILVKQLTYDAQGVLANTTELMAVQ